MFAEPFVPGSPEHLVVLGLTFTVPLALAAWARRDTTGRRGRVIALLIAAVLVGQMVGNLFLVGLTEKQRWQDFLPLHLCHFALFVCVAACVTRGPRAFAIAYFWGLGGTLQGLITPGLDRGFPSREFVFFFAGHSGIIAAIVFLAIAFRLRPTWRSVGAAYAWILVYAVAAGAFNAVFQTNYGFLCAKPRNPSLFDWLGPWPWYIASAAALAGFVFVLLYLPWALADRARSATPVNPEGSGRSS